jgi:hypothetical protein
LGHERNWKGLASITPGALSKDNAMKNGGDMKSSGLRNGFFYVLATTIFLQSAQSSATVLDELKERRNTVRAAQNKSYGAAVGTGLLVVPDIAWRIVASALIIPAFFVWNDPEVPLACNKCHDADRAIHANGRALHNIANAVRFLKEAELAYRRRHFPKRYETVAGLGLDYYTEDFRKTLSEISLPGQPAADLIEFIHAHNQTGMNGLVATHDITRSVTPKGAMQYVAPDYLGLIKDHLIEMSRVSRVQREPGAA